ncbi:MAG: hypothetical protein LM580_03915 [Thermofilum sp.]|jgi:hypothetical protein|nr:hypothetical protein [Thermofilum sp.]
MSNLRYVIEAEVSRAFHALLRELELLDLELVEAEGGFAGRTHVQTNYGPLAVEVRGRLVGNRLEMVVDLRDPPTHHVPEPVCDAVALELAKAVGRALGTGATVKCLGPLPGARPLTESLRGGEVRVWRVYCG